MADPIQFKMLIPPDVKAWLEVTAKKNARSQGAQVVLMLRTMMKAAGEELGGNAPAAQVIEENPNQEANHHDAR